MACRDGWRAVRISVAWWAIWCPGVALVMPHDLVSRIRVMGAVCVPAQVGHQGHRVTQALRFGEAEGQRMVVQEREFGIGEHEVRIAVVS